MLQFFGKIFNLVNQIILINTQLIVKQRKIIYILKLNRSINSSSSVDLLGLPYDYDSIMHYQSTAFSINGQPTILPTVDGVPATGNRQVLSSIDVAEIRKYYNCV